MKAVIQILLTGLLLPLSFGFSNAQVVTNKHFSLGTTGRIGAIVSPGIKGKTGKPLNLRGQGSIGGRLEQGDYFDLMPSIHFTPVNVKEDTTFIDFQVRMGVYPSGGQFLGNVTSRSTDGLTIAMPEAYVEARNIVGSHWSAWAGARYRRYNDIHINDYFYFDDHSSQGFGISRKQTELTMLFPAFSDGGTSATPYAYPTEVNGKTQTALRQRTIIIGEHAVKLPYGNTIKLLGEYHALPAVLTDSISYPQDKGWVVGAKLSTVLPTPKKGSFNQLAVRYGTGIANGGDGGNTFTWATYGAPETETKQFTNAYSLAIVEHFLLNVSNKFSLNGYGLFTNSRGGAASAGKVKNLAGNLVFNSKTDFAVGFRSFVYLTDWFHLLNELHYTSRKDGNQPAAEMFKFTIAPTLVPTASRDPWARPHIRLVVSAAKYNTFAAENAYSDYLQQAAGRNWGLTIGVRSEWWLF